MTRSNERDPSRLARKGEDRSTCPSDQRPARTEQAPLEVTLATLRHLDRQIFLAACVDRMDDGEIARRTGLTVAEVERRIVRVIVAYDRTLRGERAPWWQRLRRLRQWPF